MCNSLITQYFIQAPDYRPFSLTEGCISGCASGILPVLEMFHRVFVDETILSKTLPSNSSMTKNIGRNIKDVFNRHRFMVAVPLEEF